MTDLVWDEAGTRYFETGVSKGILFLMDGTAVPWNGLVSVNLDPQGGEPEQYFFDGIKYMEKTLAEDFQATISAITTPREFESCEGVREVAPGMRTHFNKRDKFHMAWRTEIGNDQDQSLGFKIHVAYNCMVQPSARAYQTISDNTTPDVRSFVITATPACGRSSYFTFDSRDVDLDDLLGQLYTGALPYCWELPALVHADSACPSLIEDFESYFPGQILSSEDKLSADGSEETFITGIVNNGLDTYEIKADGAFAANDSAASEVGTHPVLDDDDDATYITSDEGDLGYTIALPVLEAFTPGSTIELHIRMSISGDVSEDDPENLDADAQVHISTDSGGDDVIGGFSDGTDEGLGFALTAVDGSIVDYVVPLNMDAWVDSTLDDVITALKAGAYLNVVGATNNNEDTPATVNVYETSIFVLDATERNKALRSVDADSYAQVGLNIYDDTDTNYPAAVTDYVDFKVAQVPDVTVGGPAYATRVLSIASIDGPDLGILLVDYDESEEDFVQLKWFWSDTDTSIWSEEVKLNTWYRAQFDWDFSTYNIKVFERETGLVLHDMGDAQSETPWTQFTSYAGFVGS